MKHILALITSGVFIGNVLATEYRNVIFVLFDELGYGQPRRHNPQSVLRTRNLDRFAKKGMRFTYAHTATTVCVPTRYGVLTDCYRLRNGEFGVLATISKPIIPTTRFPGARQSTVDTAEVRIHNVNTHGKFAFYRARNVDEK